MVSLPAGDSPSISTLRIRAKGSCNKSPDRGQERRRHGQVIFDTVGRADLQLPALPQPLGSV